MPFQKSMDWRCLRFIRLSPVVRQKFSKRDDDIFRDYDLCAHILWMKLADEFAASTTGRQNCSVPVDRHHFRYTAFACCDHCCRSGVFGAKAHRTRGVDANADVHISVFGKKCRANTARLRKFRKLVRIDNRFGFLVEFSGCHIRSECTSDDWLVLVELQQIPEVAIQILKNRDHPVRFFFRRSHKSYAVGKHLVIIPPEIVRVEK